jgi:hypothetical protein
MRIKSLYISIFFLLFAIIYANAQELPPDEVQVNFNTYFDNFDVNIVYPDVFVNKKIDEKTIINCRYLVDVISSASMKSHFNKVYSFENIKHGIDAYTSATSRTYGGGDDTPDELRHEISLGIMRYFGETSITLNNIYSKEHDYRSETIAASISMPFAKKNTTVNFGIVRSFDKVEPEIRSWKNKKDVLTFNLGISQIFSVKFIGQMELYYSNMKGYLSDPYSVVSVIDTNFFILGQYEPISPDTRNRYAVGFKGLYRVSENASAEMGYRYYIDDWDIKSHTINAKYKLMMKEEKVIFTLGYRFYTQTACNFFQAEYYFNNEQKLSNEYMTVDPKMDKMHTSEFTMNWTFNGSIVPWVNNEDIELRTQIQYFLRTTENPDWHSGYKTLYAYLFSIGFRYLF